MDTNTKVDGAMISEAAEQPPPPSVELPERSILSPFSDQLPHDSDTLRTGPAKLRAKWYINYVLPHEAPMEIDEESSSVQEPMRTDEKELISTENELSTGLISKAPMQVDESNSDQERELILTGDELATGLISEAPKESPKNESAPESISIDKELDIEVPRKRRTTKTRRKMRSLADIYGSTENVILEEEKDQAEDKVEHL